MVRSSKTERETFIRQKGKIYKKSFLLTYRILNKIKKGMYINQIARQLNRDRKLISYYVNKLRDLGYLKLDLRTSYKQFSITPEGKDFMSKLKQRETFSLPTRKKNTRLHNLVMKFPILKDNPKAVWDKEKKLNNWIQKYSTVKFPIGITIKKTTRNIIIYFHQFYSEQRTFLSDFYSWILRGIFYVYHYLEKKNIQIDVFKGEIIQQHIASEAPELNDILDKKTTAELSLRRKAKAILPSNIDAKAWLDRSLGNVETETNDMIYEEKLLLMPENVDSMNQTMNKVVGSMNTFAKGMDQHMNLISELKDLTIMIGSTLGAKVEEIDSTKNLVEALRRRIKLKETIAERSIKKIKKEEKVKKEQRTVWSAWKKELKESGALHD